MVVETTGRLTVGQRAALEEGERDAFGTEGRELTWRPKDRHVLLRDGSGRLLASTGLLVVEVKAGADVFDVVGLGGVIVAPSCRGRGLAKVVVSAALAEAAGMAPSLALLFSRSSVVGLYEALGFRAIATPVEVEQPTGTARLSQRPMWRALDERSQWPDGDVSVRSLPF